MAVAGNGTDRMERAPGRAGPEGGVRVEAAPGDGGDRDAFPARHAARPPRVNERTAGGP